MPETRHKTWENSLDREQFPLEASATLPELGVLAL
jgi:hypothetical protein